MPDAGIAGTGPPIFLRRIAPPETVAVDENDAAQSASIINALAAMALGKIRLKTGHLLVRQSQHITHQSGSYTPV
jgi:hypothetical protein